MKQIEVKSYVGGPVKSFEREGWRELQYWTTSQSPMHSDMRELQVGTEKILLNARVIGDGPGRPDMTDYMHVNGDITRLGEHLVCIREMVGSIPIVST